MRRYLLLIIPILVFLLAIGLYFFSNYWIHRYDELIVLRKTRMPAVLLESGSIINREEELKMDSEGHRSMVSHGVAIAVREFCDSRWSILGPL